MFNAVEKGWEASGDNDISFIEGTLLFVDMSEILMADIFSLLLEVRAKQAQMDKGIHIGSWGQLQGWWSYFAF
jgi:alpha-L-fucosidase 2